MTAAGARRRCRGHWTGPLRGAWISMFHGLPGWQHFTGDPAAGGQRQLFGTGNAAVPAWCEPPGRFISPAEAVTVRRALADAEAFRRDRAGARCADCQDHPAEACDDHVDDLDQADAYRDLAAMLADGDPDEPTTREIEPDAPGWCDVPDLEEDRWKIRLHGTQEECEEAVTLLSSIMLIHSVSEPYPDRGCSVLVRVYVEAIPRGGR